MASTDKDGVDPKAVALYLGTLAGVAAVSWLASRIAQPKPNPRMDGVGDER